MILDARHLDGYPGLRVELSTDLHTCSVCVVNQHERVLASQHGLTGRDALAAFRHPFALLDGDAILAVTATHDETYVGGRYNEVEDIIAYHERRWEELGL